MDEKENIKLILDQYEFFLMIKEQFLSSGCIADVEKIQIDYIFSPSQGKNA